MRKFFRFWFTFGPCTFWSGHDWRGVYDNDGAPANYVCADCKKRKVESR